MPASINSAWRDGTTRIHDSTKGVVFGGGTSAITQETITNTVETLTLEASGFGSVASATALGTSRSNATAFGNASKAFVSGGNDRDMSETLVMLNTTERYSFPSMTKETNAGSLSEAFYGGSSASIGQKAFVFLGAGYISSYTDKVEKCNMVTGTFSVLSAFLANQYHFNGPCANNDSRALIFGGGVDQSGNHFNNDLHTAGVSIFRMAAEVSEGVAASLSFRRSYMSAAGNRTRVIVSGGTVSGGVACEQYLYATPGTKGAAPESLAFTRVQHSSVASERHAFFIGGWESSTNFLLNTVESYLFAAMAHDITNPAILDDISSARNEMAATQNRQYN
jgi:hypothetical protein